MCFFSRQNAVFLTRSHQFTQLRFNASDPHVEYTRGREQQDRGKQHASGEAAAVALKLANAIPLPLEDVGRRHAFFLDEVSVAAISKIASRAR